MTKKILAIGGSDPFSGGGIQTDLKTFENHQIFGLSALTCIAVVANGAFTVHDIQPQLLAEQLNSFPEQFLDGIKIGLVHNPDSIMVIKNFLLKNPTVPVVLDPVFAFKETTSTYAKEYILSIKKELFPLATIITPNLSEAEILVGQKIQHLEEMETAAELLYQTGGKAVVIKGGMRLSGYLAYDLFYEGKKHYPFSKEKLSNDTVNGAGCAFSSAITANLAQNIPSQQAVALAKDYVYESIQNGVIIDADHGSVWHQGAHTNSKIALKKEAQ